MKKLWLLLLIGIFLVPTAQAALKDFAVVYINFDDNNVSGANSLDSTEFNRDATILGSATTGASLVLGESYDMDGTDDGLTWPNGTIPSIATGSVTWWMELDSHVNYDTIFHIGDSGANRWMMRMPTSTQLFVQMTDAGDSTFAVPEVTGSVYFYALVWNGSHTRLYVNNTLIGDDPYVGGYTNVSHWITFFARNELSQASDRFPDGEVDEFAIWNKTLTVAEIDSLWNGGAGYNPFVTPPVPDTLNITSTVPANNTQWNAGTIEFNATIETNQTANCSLYINSTLNGTTANSGSGTIGVNVTFPADTQENYDYYFFCDNNDINETSTTFFFHIDRVAPTITWNIPANDNSTIISGNLTANITVADNNLYIYDLNITTLAGTHVYNYTNISIQGETSYEITNTSWMGEMGELSLPQSEYATAILTAL